MSQCEVAGCGNQAMYPCGICGKGICPDHVVNRSYSLAGDVVGCPEHQQEIDQLNAQIHQERREKFRKGR